MAIQTLGNFGSGVPQPAAPPANAQRAAVQQPATEAAVPAMPPAEQSPSKEQVQKAVQEIKKSVESSSSSNLQFSVDDETGRTVVRVIDKTTGDVIRQIPSEEVIALSKAMDQMTGLLLRQQA